MDKYEYQLKTEHIRQVAARKEYNEAAKLCDAIDWTKIRDVKMLTLAADVYTAVGEYDKAIDILQQAYQYAAMGRRIVYRLTELALKAGSYDDAKNYFEEFCRIAPNDQGRYILLYKMARFQKATLDEKIQILEAYKREDFDEKWAYELAVLYAMNNQKDKCIQLCDDIILWFGLGKYVEKALSLKSQFAPLTPAQKEKVQKFADKKAQEENEKLQKAQQEQEQKQQEAKEAEKAATQQKILKWQEEQEKAYQAEQEAAKEEAKAREAEQKAALEREEQLRLQREKEAALKEEKEREDARKAAESLREQKEREEQIRLQHEQEEREAVERLKKAQRQEHASRSVVTSDMNEIMAVIQRARQEDAQRDLQAALAQEVLQVQQENAEEEKAQVEAKSEAEVEETVVEPESILEEEAVEELEEQDATTDEISKDEAPEDEIPENETEQETQEEVSDELPETVAVEEPEIPAGQADTDTFAEVSDAAEITSEYPAYENADELTPEADEIQFEELEAPVEMEPEASDESAEESDAVEEASEESAEELDADEEASEESAEESDAVEEAGEESAEESDAVEEAGEESDTAEELQQIPDENEPAETPIEEYEERRQAERAGKAGLPIVNPEDLSRVWHFAIQAMPSEDDIELALEYLQELAESSPRAVPQSVVKITGQKLNQKGLVQSLDKLLGKTILIENAADMNDRVINEFCKIIDPTDRSLLVVFIDTPASIRHLLLDHPQLAQTITAQFVRENYSVSELLEYARGYADREDSVFDKSGELALMERLKVISANQERNKKRIVEMIVNNAIEKAEKKSMRKLFQSKYDKKGCLILRDKDFEVG